MNRVVILSEDRTGGGLEKLIQKELGARLGHDAVGFPEGGSWNQKNNREVLKRCMAYERYRFGYGFDHVVYIVDAKEGWTLVGMDPPKPSDDTKQYLAQLREAVVAEMARLARSERDDADWEQISSGFHGHILVWERESLLLPVADALGLGQPVPDPYTVRGAAAEVVRRHQEFKGSKYAKGATGQLYLEKVLASGELRQRVLESNESLRAIVDGLVSACERA